MFAKTIKKLDREIFAINISLIFLLIAIITETILICIGVFAFDIISFGIIVLYIFLYRRLMRIRLVKLVTKIFYQVLGEKIDK